MNNPYAEKNCKGCGKRFTPRADGRGRPSEYCDPYCRKYTPCVECGIPCSRKCKRCWECGMAFKRTQARRFYTQSLMEWVERFGRPPTASEWNISFARTRWTNPARLLVLEDIHAERDWPRYSAVLEMYGTWNAFLEAHGFSTLEPGGHQVEMAA